MILVNESYDFLHIHSNQSGANSLVMVIFENHILKTNNTID